MAGRRRRVRNRLIGSRRGLVFVGLTIAAGLAGGLVSADRAAKLASGPLTATRLDILARSPAKAPAALQSRLDALAADYGEEVGIAVTDVQAGWTAGVDRDRPYPQQSVSKLWVAIAVMKAADEGRLDPEAPLTLTEADRSVFFQPVSYKIGPAGYTTPLSDLLRRALVESDNAANDRLMRELGGPEGVAATLDEMGLTAVKVGAYERDLQARTAGLVWQADYGIGWNFQAARQALPMDVRKEALDAYLADPPDGTTPAAITAALAALHRGELLSAASTQRLIGLMEQARTGPRRLKGGLPPGWTIAHKTGTGQDFAGASVGINDVGLLTAPDGRTYAVAVMLRHTRQPVPARLAFMQSVTRTVAEHWAAEAAGVQAAD
ncbi:serine hydrolase [Phenylobacterium kunshanense]|uniref:beta-lactamase n=1 Tax=Phenylobacterium kunshanense TaxID=1445034 RepID=A0A328BLJ7_9CAUL|nr:serine hydrolase [Phenylobacterium kunshanense]RAK67555.1 serine hydrolase [Phenylobacterium kunshanense]